MRSRFITAVTGIVAASAFTVSAPAMASIGTEGGGICLTSSQTTLWAAEVDLSNTFGDGVDAWEVPMGDPAFTGSSTGFDIDPVTNIGYFVESTGQLWSVDLETEEFSHIAATSRADDAAHLDYDLAYDEATGTMYILMFNEDDEISQAGTIDLETGVITVIDDFFDGLENHTMDGLAFYDGALWAIESMDDSSAPWVVRYDANLDAIGAEYGWLGRLQRDATYVVSADISVDGILYVVTYDEFADTYAFESLDVTDPLNVVAVDDVSVTEWATDCGFAVRDPQIVAVEDNDGLASTGFESNALIAGSAALVAIGSTIALRRRARR